MSSARRPLLPITLCLTGVALICQARLAAQSPDSVEFFENRIRPVLVQECYECHASQADELGGSLLLDSSHGMMNGGDSGPAIDPGNVQGSLLISAIRYESSEMPPSGKLPERVIHDFEQWIAAGATDPRTTDTQSSGTSRIREKSRIDFDEARAFWAFQPLASTPTPAPLKWVRGGRSIRSWMIVYGKPRSNPIDWLSPPYVCVDSPSI